MIIVFFELPLALLDRHAISLKDVLCHKRTVKAIHVNLLVSSLRVWPSVVGGDLAFIVIKQPELSIFVTSLFCKVS